MLEQIELDRAQLIEAKRRIDIVSSITIVVSELLLMVKESKADQQSSEKFKNSWIPGTGIIIGAIIRYLFPESSIGLWVIGFSLLAYYDAVWKINSLLTKIEGLNNQLRLLNGLENNIFLKALDVSHNRIINTDKLGLLEVCDV